MSVWKSGGERRAEFVGEQGDQGVAQTGDAVACGEKSGEEGGGELGGRGGG